MATKKLVKKKATKTRIKKEHIGLIKQAKAFAQKEPLVSGIDVCAPELPSTVLTDIEVIDMRGMLTLNRIAILGVLKSEGYINANTEDLIDFQDNLLNNINCDALELNHKNKLVFIRSWMEVCTNQFISRAHIHIHTDIAFDYPTPAAPPHVYMNGCTYVRID